MRYGSVCSGIEAATVAWHPLGWEPVFFAEIEAFPSAVLEQRWPGVPNLGDFTRIGRDVPCDPIDILVGGTPCQSFSVAGLRGGLDDARGNLALEFLRLADRLRPRWVVWENVPGVLSSVSHDAPDLCPPPPPVDVELDGAEVETEDEYGSEELHAFNCFVAGLSELGYGWAFWVPDAQYFRLAQRRRRVFVVGCLGSWQRAAAVLLESSCLSWNPPPRREKGQGVAESLTHGVDSSGKGGYAGRRREDDVNLAVDLQNAGLAEQAGTIQAEGSATGNRGYGVLANPLGAKRDGGWLGDLDNDTFVAYQCQGTNVGQMGTLRSGNGNETGGVPFTLAIRGRGDSHDLEIRQDGLANAVLTPSGGRAGIGVGAVAYAIQERAVCEHPDAGPDGAGFRDDGLAYTLEARQQPQAVAFDARQSDVIEYGDKTGPLDTDGHTTGVATFDERNITSKGNRSRVESGAPCHSVHEVAPGVISEMTVRRLTPRECERLMGLPDDYTLIDHKGKPAADGPRYRAIGNSMAVPVMAWIGRRIEMCEQVEEATA